jgi:N-acylneuraminate cytidylyltransferase
MKVVAFIFARGNSKGIKNKNLVKINGKSLLERAILVAKKSKYISDVYVSTDSKKILNLSKKLKIITPFIRPKKLSTDSSPEILAWKHAVHYLYLNNIKTDYIVSIPTTSPLRTSKDVDRCINKAINTNVDILFAVTPSSKNPFFNMIKINKNNSIELLMKPKKLIYNRQSAPKVFDLTTVCYVFKTNYIRNTNNIFSGKTGYVVIPKERALDIDSYYDLKIAKKLIKK